MRKMLEIPHRMDDYACMWNGVEDLYIRDTGETLPPKFFYVLSSFGSFCYMKTPKAQLKRMVALGDGRTRQMYEFLAPIVGFDYKLCEYKTFEKALAKVRAEIDAGFPCMIGALDMFYLPHFEKLYHKEHIPFHYELATGYDDAEGLLYFSDCGREDTQVIPYDELRLAFDCAYPGLSKPNTVWTIRMHTDRGKYEIAKEALARKKELFLHPPVGFVGCRGFEKFIQELPRWKTELTREDYDRQLYQMVQFLGAVPTIPNALRGINEPDSVAFGGGFDKAAAVLESLGKEYHDEAMTTAAAAFRCAVPAIGQIKETIVEYLTGRRDETKRLPALFSQAADSMRAGFEALTV
ncbi:BtrH N-terminal domain-containing protein [uncultured Oscillibacter sp.]|uniref:BtrH N-terminal domain-containing protein n=1 Tax=uncultured Oscillibacter sp. TaxID=876091 RepID=UPI0025DE71D5|nr:BtrH N-terminal domain-containing protein [uncultured Oscillibacter sp.]